MLSNFQVLCINLPGGVCVLVGGVCYVSLEECVSINEECVFYIRKECALICPVLCMCIVEECVL